MKPDCRSAVQRAVPDVFTSEEIDDVLARLQAAKERAQKADPTGHDGDAFDAAARQITKEEVMKILRAQRTRAAKLRAQGSRRKRFETLMADGLSEDEALRAHDVGVQKAARGSGESVDAEQIADVITLWGLVEKPLQADPELRARLSSPLLERAEAGLEGKVVQELARLNGAAVEATGDAGAAKAAAIFHKAQEAARLLLNRQGAWIGKIKGYISSQNHDRARVAGGLWRGSGGARGLFDPGRRRAAAQQAFRAWRDVQKAELSDETFEGLTLNELKGGLDRKGQFLLTGGAVDDPNDPVETFLFHAWWNIVTGRSETVEGGATLGEVRGPPSLAGQLSRPRVFIYRDHNAWMRYADQYAPGGIYRAIMTDLERAGRNAALMRRWGPNPAADRAEDIDWLAQRAMSRGDTDVHGRLTNRLRDAEFDELTGLSNVAKDLRLASIGRTIRMAEVFGKLGSVVISAMGDGSFAAQTMKRAGGTYLDGYQGFVQGVARLQGEEGRIIADALDVGARATAASLTTRFSAADGPMGWGNWGQRVFFRFGLFEGFQNGHRSGQAQMLASIWGGQADRAWDGLSVGSQETFERFGIDAGAWDLLRAGATEMSDTRRYITLDAVEAADDDGLLAWSGWNGAGDRVEAVADARADLELRYRAMLETVLADALTEPRARERAVLHRGMRPGTLEGEAMRLFTQFLSFPFAVIHRHVTPALKGYAGETPVALMAHLIIASTALGFLSLQMKQVIKGQKPRGLENEDGDSLTGSLFIASLLQGGGLGIYGDFLFGEANRNGLPATLSTLAGPAIGDGERLFQIIGKAVWGAGVDEDDEEKQADARRDAAGDAARFGITSLPASNLWYTRWALDYLVLWRLQEAMSPGYLERYEKRVERITGAEFIVSPSEAVGAQ